MYTCMSFDPKRKLFKSYKQIRKKMSCCVVHEEKNYPSLSLFVNRRKDKEERTNGFLSPN